MLILCLPNECVLYASVFIVNNIQNCYVSFYIYIYSSFLYYVPPLSFFLNIVSSYQNKQVKLLFLFVYFFNIFRQSENGRTVSNCML